MPVPQAFLAIREDLNSALRDIFTSDEFEGFSPWEFESDADKPWSLRWKWIAAYPVTGTSEGHWIHVDLIMSGEEGGSVHKHIFKTKTFAGWDTACRIANETAKLLGA